MHSDHAEADGVVSMLVVFLLIFAVVGIGLIIYCKQESRRRVPRMVMNADGHVVHNQVEEAKRD